MSNEPKRSEDSPPNPRQNSGQITPFESIRRTNPAGNEFWSSRDFAKVLGYADYRNFQSVIESARTACFNSGQRVEDHFVEVTDMIEVGKGAKRPAKSVMMSVMGVGVHFHSSLPCQDLADPFLLRSKKHENPLTAQIESFLGRIATGRRRRPDRR